MTTLLFQRVFGRVDAGRRSLVTLVVRGQLRIQWGTFCVSIGEGQGVYLPEKTELVVRTEGAAYESIVTEWDAETRGPACVLQVDAAEVATLAKDIHTADAPDLAVIARAKALLSRAGVPTHELRFAGTHDLGAAEQRAQEIADALDAVLSSLDTQPMVTDLEVRLGVTARQVTRLVDAFRVRYGYGATNWRETRNRRRLMLAATLLSDRESTVGDVARAVGYGSPETLARAFAQAGFPRPSAVHEEVAALETRWQERLAEARAGA